MLLSSAPSIMFTSSMLRTVPDACATRPSTFPRIGLDNCEPGSQLSRARYLR